MKRSLTPADGVVDAVAVPGAATKIALPQRDSDREGFTGGAGLVAAAAMTGVAVGLEIAGIISRRRNS